MILPRPLQRGGMIGICAPAGPVKRERLERAISNLEQSGFRVVTSPSAFGQDGLFAATDDIRRSEMEAMFTDERVDAVFCTRGGVGCSRLLPKLDLDIISSSHKPFLGFSDVTALQWHLWNARRFVTFQGPLAVEWDGSVNEASLNHALNVLCGEAPSELTASTSSKLEILRAGRSNSLVAPLMPGNLTMITTLLGTPYMPDLTGTILLLEDVNEPPHRIDRMLFHLKNAGCLDKLAALLIGDLFESKEPEKQTLVFDAIRDVTRGTSYPIVCGLPYSHGEDRLTFPVGAAMELQLNPCTLKFTDWCETPVSV